MLLCSVLPAELYLVASVRARWRLCRPCEPGVSKCVFSFSWEGGRVLVNKDVTLQLGCGAGFLVPVAVHAGVAAPLPWFGSAVRRASGPFVQHCSKSSFASSAVSRLRIVADAGGVHASSFAALVLQLCAAPLVGDRDRSRGRMRAQASLCLWPCATLQRPLLGALRPPRAVTPALLCAPCLRQQRRSFRD